MHRSAFTFNVVVESLADLVVFEFRLTYDPAVVQVEEAVLGDFPRSTGWCTTLPGLVIDNAVVPFRWAVSALGSRLGPAGRG